MVILSLFASVLMACLSDFGRLNLLYDGDMSSSFKIGLDFCMNQSFGPVSLVGSIPYSVLML